jgi:hypothetical protein
MLKDDEAHYAVQLLLPGVMPLLLLLKQVLRMDMLWLGLHVLEQRRHVPLS